MKCFVCGKEIRKHERYMHVPCYEAEENSTHAQPQDYVRMLFNDSIEICMDCFMSRK